MEELGIQIYPKFAFKYNVTELSTAVKPYLLEMLFHRKGVDKLLYIDPDIIVLLRLDRLYEALERANIVLTPHLDADYPDDGQKPDDSMTMQVGMFNLGFIGVNSSANPSKFLKWWQGKFYTKCVIDYGAGYFVDQKFLDLALFCFDGIYIEKDTGYNVAIHNLHSRRLSFEDGAWSCNGKPLYFYHFCGFDYSDSSKYANITLILGTASTTGPTSPRSTTTTGGLVRANGQEVTSRWRYTYGYFDTGEWIIDPLRKQYRDSEELGPMRRSVRP